MTSAVQGVGGTPSGNGHGARLVRVRVCPSWPVKSTTRAQDGLYLYDTVARLYDSRFGDGDVKDIKRYIRLGPLGALPRQAVPHSGAAAFVARRRPLIAAGGLAALTAFLVSYFVG